MYCRIAMLGNFRAGCNLRRFSCRVWVLILYLVVLFSRLLVGYHVIGLTSCFYTCASFKFGVRDLFLFLRSRDLSKTWRGCCFSFHWPFFSFFFYTLFYLENKDRDLYLFLNLFIFAFSGLYM